MTRNTEPISIRADCRRRGTALVVALAVLTLLGTVAAAGTTTAQSAQPTVVVTDGTVSTDGTTNISVVLTSAPEGLSGYYFDLNVENPETAAIQSVSYPDRFGLTSDPAIGTGGATVTLEAADMEGTIEPGATNVTLATVTIVGTSPGEAAVTVRPRQFDDDSGTVFTPTTQSGTIAVTGSGESVTAGATTSPAVGGDSDGSSTGETEVTSVSQPLSPVLPIVALLTTGGLIHLFSNGRNQ